MSKELEKVQGVNVIREFSSNDLGSFGKLFCAMMSGPRKHQYYELVDDKGKIVQIVCTTEVSIVQSAAHRMGLDYRLVEFEEVFKDVDSAEKK